jgi:hypothetical protein
MPPQWLRRGIVMMPRSLHGVIESVRSHFGGISMSPGRHLRGSSVVEVWQSLLNGTNALVSSRNATHPPRFFEAAGR